MGNDFDMENFKAQFQDLKKFVDFRLEQYMANEEPLLEDFQRSMSYSLHLKAKRIRPIFCFIVGELFGVSRRELVSLACALEMIHTASLIMDDLPYMDDTDTRRGSPANHVVFGSDVAALASIGLLTKAFEVVLGDPEMSENNKVKILEKLAHMVGVNGMVGGQFVDLRSSNQSSKQTALEYIHSHKTASLFVASGSTAAILGNARNEEIRAVVEFAKYHGLIFQIVDDLLDALGRIEEVGKTLKRDQFNYISVYGVEKSKQLVQLYSKKALEAIKIFDGKNQKLIALGKILINRRW